jgi:hypothetical protein
MMSEKNINTRYLETFYLSIRKVMLLIYDIEKSLYMSPKEKEIVQLRKTEGIKYRMEVPESELRLNARVHYSQLVIIVLVTALECYLQDRAYSLIQLINKKGTKAPYSFQNLEKVEKFYREAFQIELFKDVDRGKVFRLFEFRHLVVHRGGFIDDKERCDKCSLSPEWIGKCVHFKKERVEEYLKEVVETVSSIERQCDILYYKNRPK